MAKKPNTHQGSGSAKSKKRAAAKTGTANNVAAAAAAAQRRRNAARAAAARTSGSVTVSPVNAPPAKPGAPGAPAVPALAAPTPVPGFSTGADLAEINDFLTNYSTQVEDIDNALAAQNSDTKFQKTANDKSAKVGTVQTADDMAGRGIFQSSVKDAALYDIEAQRALSNKFLDDKLTTATLQAGTRKRTLAEGKKRFDTAMLLRQGENAAPINDAANQAYADQRAAAATAPKPAAPKPPKPKAYKPPKPKAYKPPKPKKAHLVGTATVTGAGLN